MCHICPVLGDGTQHQITALTLSTREIFEAYKASPLRGGDGKVDAAKFDVAAELPDAALAQVVIGGGQLALSYLTEVAFQ